jgi:hypothetical protein
MWAEGNEADLYDPHAHAYDIVQDIVAHDVIVNDILHAAERNSDSHAHTYAGQTE